MIAAHATTDVEAVVSWNPLTSAIVEEPSANKHFDSLDIPEEIIDLMIVDTVTSAANSNFGKVLTGAWYEMMGLMAAGGEAVPTDKAKAFVTDLASCKVLLTSTEMFFDPADAVVFTWSDQLFATMANVPEFLFDKGILGEAAPSAEFVPRWQCDGRCWQCDLPF